MTAWTSPAPQLRDGPTQGSEREILQGYLNYQRSTLLNICQGLTAAQLVARAVPPSTLSLLGIIRHMAKVERIWLRQRAAAVDIEPLHGGAGAPGDFDDTDPVLAESDVQQLQAEWAAGDAAVAGLALDHEVPARDETWSLRLVYSHLIGEYARHNGHADLLRQRIDGVTGR